MGGERRRRSSLVDECIEAASRSRESVERWRLQRRTLERLPSHLADSLFRRLLRRRLLYPSLLEVFRHSVEEVDLKGKGNVDAEWMAYLGAFRNLRILNIADCRSVNSSALWPVTGLNSLKELDMSRCLKITDAGIKHLLSIPTLEKLFVSETGLTADGVMLLSSLRNLRVLDLGGIPVNDKALSKLQVLTRLEHLDLWGSDVSNEGADVLKLFPTLSFLNIAWTNVTKLPNLPSITCLNMSNCTIHSFFSREGRTDYHLSKLLIAGANFTDADEAFTNVVTSYMAFLDMSGSSIGNFHFLVNMKRLEHLDLGSTRITDSLIEHVSNVGEGLRYLNLSSTKITNEAICILTGHLVNIETLSLSHTAIDDASLPYIGMMASLRKINLSHTKIKGFLSLEGDSLNETWSLSELQNLSLLENLNLEETLVRDEALYPLAFFKELKCLYLKSAFLSDISLRALSSPLPKLRVLGFRGAVLTNSGLLLYRPPPLLRLLDLRGCWLLTADFVSSFSAHHSQIELRHEHVSNYSADLNAASSSSSFSQMTLASRLRVKGKKLLQAPKVTFIDERIKYTREELLELQLSPSSFTLINGDVLPEMLRKKHHGSSSPSNYQAYD
ncbi:uncharacterized protein M6B38_411260 [Iris pallida]|uniref:Uncharacterized protein n=1 Tax=Iris pallida TaxID=29817 RepID=A0AAX6FN43_IRIPA|nr:uncharacterized protein M6B38_411260 [Iris pallida]